MNYGQPMQQRPKARDLSKEQTKRRRIIRIALCIAILCPVIHFAWITLYPDHIPAFVLLCAAVGFVLGLLDFFK